MGTNAEPATHRPRWPRWVEDAERLDLAIYAAIARTPTPTLDVAMSRLSRAADYSRLSLTSAALLALSGGRTGRRAANVPLARHVPMPSTRSFPSGHSAAAFAFATGVGHTSPAAAVPLHALAALIAYSRVHTGVHYPADVLAGGLIGTTLAQVTTHLVRNWSP